MFVCVCMRLCVRVCRVCAQDPKAQGSVLFTYVHSDDFAEREELTKTVTTSGYEQEQPRYKHLLTSAKLRQEVRDVVCAQRASTPFLCVMLCSAGLHHTINGTPGPGSTHIDLCAVPCWAAVFHSHSMYNPCWLHVQFACIHNCVCFAQLRMYSHRCSTFAPCTSWQT